MVGMIPIGLDFGAILSMGAAMRADQQMLAELLPSVEGAALAALRTDPQEEFEDAE